MTEADLSSAGPVSENLGPIGPIEIRELRAKFSGAELQVCTDAFDAGRLSRKHFSGPGAPLRYRSLLWQKSTNCGNLPRGVQMHFAMLRTFTRTQYYAATNLKGSAGIILRPGASGENVWGKAAAPGCLAEIMQRNSDSAQRGQTTLQKSTKQRIIENGSYGRT